jgi:hypothetical protein|nr:MAG TPA: hypothetical protein [Caudoviricetes sp.]
MLHLIGKPYIMQHCIIASRREQLDISYRAYMTDALASLAGVEERWVDRVSDLVNDRPQAPQPSSEEVIAHIKNGLNGGDGT